MKLNDLKVEELSSQEMASIDGGFWWFRVGISIFDTSHEAVMDAYGNQMA